jgi:predicted metal-dependent HD superfamily phosphohydrolase
LRIEDCEWQALWQNFGVESDTQAIKDAYTEKLKALYNVMADAFIGGENLAQAERDFQKAAKLARTARDTAIGLLPK